MAINLAGKTKIKRLVPLIARAQFFYLQQHRPHAYHGGTGHPSFCHIRPRPTPRTRPYRIHAQRRQHPHTIIQQQLEAIPVADRHPVKTGHMQDITAVKNQTGNY